MNENKHRHPVHYRTRDAAFVAAETTEHFLDKNRSLFNNRARAEVVQDEQRWGSSRHTHKIKVRTMASLCAASFAFLVTRRFSYVTPQVEKRPA